MIPSFILAGVILAIYAAIVEARALRFGHHVPTRAHIAGGAGTALIFAALLVAFI